MIESIKDNHKAAHYLDHDSEDTTTTDFLLKNSLITKKSIIIRSYYDEVYSIIRAVELGLGRTVVPKHLIKNNNQIKILSQYKAQKVPIYLIYYQQQYYSQLQFLEYVKKYFSIST